jgi:hypothetical protein
MKGLAKHFLRTIVLLLILFVGWFAGVYSGKRLANNQVRVYLNNHNSHNDKLTRVLSMIENDSPEDA